MKRPAVLLLAGRWSGWCSSERGDNSGLPSVHPFTGICSARRAAVAPYRQDENQGPATEKNPWPQGSAALTADEKAMVGRPLVIPGSQRAKNWVGRYNAS